MAKNSLATQKKLYSLAIPMSERKTSFGQWLSTLRNKRGLSQQQLADRTHKTVSKAYISLLENDRPHGVTGAPPSPSRDKLEALAKALDVSIVEVLQAAGWQVESMEAPVTEQIPVASIAADDEEQKIDALFYDYKRLSAKDKQELRVLIDAIGEQVRKRLNDNSGTT